MNNRTESAAGGQGSSSVGSPLKDWEATIDLQPIVQPEPLKVGGLYHLDQRCGSASLKVAVPQGSNPRILLLALVTERGSGGNWISVEGRFKAEEGQYDSVQIRDEESNSISVDIKEVH